MGDTGVQVSHLIIFIFLFFLLLLILAVILILIAATAVFLLRVLFLVFGIQDVHGIFAGGWGWGKGG